MKSKVIGSISDAALQTALAVGADIVAGVLGARPYNKVASCSTSSHLHLPSGPAYSILGSFCVLVFERPLENRVHHSLCPLLIKTAAKMAQNNIAVPLILVLLATSPSKLLNQSQGGMCIYRTSGIGLGISQERLCP